MVFVLFIYTWYFALFYSSAISNTGLLFVLRGSESIFHHCHNTNWQQPPLDKKKSSNTKKAISGNRWRRSGVVPDEDRKDAWGLWFGSIFPLSFVTDKSGTKSAKRGKRAPPASFA